MGFREDLIKRIEKKKAEISALEAQLLAARTYLEALQDMYKLAGKGTATAESSAPSFRSGSMLAAAYEAIKKAGRPVHVNELLPAIGRTVTRADRSAVSGTLAAYVRRGEVFTRPAPNTFGLVEHGEVDAEEAQEPVPPAGFGRL